MVFQELLVEAFGQSNPTRASDQIYVRCRDNRISKAFVVLSRALPLDIVSAEQVRTKCMILITRERRGDLLFKFN